MSQFRFRSFNLAPILDRDVTSKSKDPLQGIGGLMTRAKTKRMKQALQGLIREIKLEATSKWVTFLQLQDNALSPRLRP